MKTNELRSLLNRGSQQDSQPVRTLDDAARETARLGRDHLSTPIGAPKGLRSVLVVDDETGTVERVLVDDRWDLKVRD